jgi:GT2 family glycosyltransferase
MRFVIAEAVHNCASYLKLQFPYLENLDPCPDLVLFCENNSPDDTFEVLQDCPLPFEVIKYHFRDDAASLFVNPYSLIAIARQFLLQRARSLDPDFLFFLDGDVIPVSHDCLGTLSSYGRDIVGGSYLRLFPEGVRLASKWYSPSRRVFYLKELPDRDLDTPVYTSAGALMLSSRIVQDRRLEFFPLWDDETSEDFGFCLKASKLGYQTFLDCTARFVHYVQHLNYKPWAIDVDYEKRTGVRRYIPWSYSAIERDKFMEAHKKHDLNVR